jgi:hypothetical protein
MANPNMPPPAYSDNAPSLTNKTYGATDSPTSAVQPLLGAQRGMLASGSGRDAWMESGDDLEAAGDGYGVKDERTVDECDMVIRMAFIRKVYS